MNDIAMTKAPDYVLVEWEKYKKTQSFTNTKKWATSQHNSEFVDGAIWAAWYEGWKAHRDWGNTDKE